MGDRTFDDWQAILKSFIARSLVGTGLLYFVEIDGLHKMGDQVKAAATVSAGTLISQSWVEPNLMKSATS